MIDTIIIGSQDIFRKIDPKPMENYFPILKYDAHTKHKGLKLAKNLSTLSQKPVRLTRFWQIYILVLTKLLVSLKLSFAGLLP